MNNWALMLLLSAALLACGQEDARSPEDDAAFKASFRQANQLADCEVAYTIQADVIHNNNEAENRKYRSLAREAHLAAAVTVALDWNTVKKRPFEFYSELVDSWTEVDYKWWADALERSAQAGGGDTLMLLDVYHSPTMQTCSGLRSLQSSLAAMAGDGDLK